MTATTEIPQTVEWCGQKVPVYPMQTVDFGLLLSQEPAEVEKLLRCCQTDGFFYLDLSGFDGRRFLEDQKHTLDLMYRFFESSLEAKNQFGLISPHLGYEPVGARNGVMPNSRDGYEMVKVSRDEIQMLDPLLPNVMKSSGDLRILENTISGCNIVTKSILSALSTAMGLTGASRFENMHRNDRPSTSTLAMMHYVPTDPAATAKNIGHQKHTDISSLTLLWSDQWGMQIKPPGAREFGFVAPKPGCAVMNVGDSLRFASGHTMQSCIHRVVPFRADEHRYSIAYFLRAEDDATFTDSEGRLTTAGKWHDEKFAAFRSLPAIQALAPKTMLLGGMQELEEPAAKPAEESLPIKDAPSPIQTATALNDARIVAH